MVQTPAGVSWCSHQAQARLDHISCCAPPPCTSRHTPPCTMHTSPYTLHITLHISTHPVSHNALVCSLTANAQSLHMPHFRSQLAWCTSKYKDPCDTTHTILIKGAHIHALLTLTHFSHELPSTLQTKLHLSGRLITHCTVETFTRAHKPALCRSGYISSCTHMVLLG